MHKATLIFLFRRLTRNTKLYKNIHATRSAISSRSRLAMNVVDIGEGNWAFQTKHVEAPEATLTSDQVGTINIPDLIKRYNISFIDILKIDIEGAEAELFERGYQEWLPLTRCLIIELHDRFVPGLFKKSIQGRQRV